MSKDGVIHSGGRFCRPIYVEDMADSQARPRAGRHASQGLGSLANASRRDQDSPSFIGGA